MIVWIQKMAESLGVGGARGWSAHYGTRRLDLTARSPSGACWLRPTCTRMVQLGGCLVKGRDGRSTTWTHRSIRPTEQGAPPRSLTPASPHTPPTRPTDPTPLARHPVACPPVHSTPHHPCSRPRLLHPDRSTPHRPPDLTPLHPPSHASPANERLFLLCLAPPHHRWAPLPPPPSASPIGAPASSDPVPHKMTEKITKWLSKSQNDWLLYQNPKNGWVKF
jgi:hypothetical protein